jgi:metal-sulfur cluster biosynthetic enzyme
VAIDRDAVLAALGRVIDPCSVGAGAAASIVEMGLIQSLASETDRVLVTLRLTSPVCAQVSGICAAIEREVGSVPGVTVVQCEVDCAAEWWPDLMASAVQQRLRQLRPVPVRPRP